MELIHIENKIQCNNCSNEYILKNNSIIFDNRNFLSKNENVIKELLQKIKKFGYEKGIEKFIIKNDEFKEQLVNTQYDKSIDFIFHGIGKKFSKCLNIDEGLGNKSEILSKIFKQVYTIEFNDELIELQNIRFNEKRLNNISIIKSNLLRLPFPDNYFDLILANDILDNIEKFAEKENLKDVRRKIIQELKRVINNDGCIIFGVKNHRDSDKKYKNKILNLLKVNKKKFLEDSLILNGEGLFVKPFWTFPSYGLPLYSGEIFDEISLKAFFKNIISHVSISNKKKYQIKIIVLMLSIFKKINYPFIKTLIHIISPSFVLCCWKKNDEESLENWIKNKTNYKNVLRMSRHEKILFMLLNKKSEIEKCVYIKRYGYKIPNEIKFFEREFPTEKIPTERIILTNWLKGRPINTKNQNEVIEIINELIKFQNKTKARLMSTDDISKEIMFIKNGLEYFECNKYEYDEWIKQYEKYMEAKNIRKTSVHGDFWFSNIIYDSESRKITFIDWEGYTKEGNPFEDIIWLLCNLMGMSTKEYAIQFKKHLEKKGEMSQMIKLIENKINSHFGFKLDFILLLKIYLIKWMIIQKQIKEKNSRSKINLKNVQIMKHEEILNILSKY